MKAGSVSLSLSLSSTRLVPRLVSRNPLKDCLLSPLPQNLLINDFRFSDEVDHQKAWVGGGLPQNLLINDFGFSDELDHQKAWVGGGLPQNPLIRDYLGFQKNMIPYVGLIKSNISIKKMMQICNNPHIC